MGLRETELDFEGVLWSDQVWVIQTPLEKWHQLLTKGKGHKVNGVGLFLGS
jgi:hypothetical protein